MIQYKMLGLNPSFGPSCLFWSKCLCPWKWGQSHQNLITSFPGPNAGHLCASLVKIHILVYLVFLVDRLQKSSFKLISWSTFIPLLTTVNEITIKYRIINRLCYSCDLNLDKLKYVCEIKLIRISPKNHNVRHLSCTGQEGMHNAHWIVIK